MSVRTDVRENLKIARWAAVPTLLMALLNAAAGPGSDGTDMPKGLAWAATVVGLAGLIAGIALLRRATWAVPAVGAIGVVNLVLAVVAVVAGWEGAVIGIALSLAALALLAPAFRR